ncbi:UpxZ family transcription anti-terminator antagonist [Bacteroides sp. 519]|uniref:UpxZ family transcription anti-terminator antagonist n=1 Tax=Bacteroides sp. 519 TaxID=2302937 RepID=UPI0013D7135E|nr:UpxZ family transcription anti-terminator antagonist [Bacteroides sp. 519]NDV58977.1 transcriptional regulator [Bacteroides sp. 519]
MNKVTELYQSAYRLLHLGEDGSPVYSDEFSRLNTEVLQQAESLYITKGDTPEEEGELCLALLMGFNASIYNNGDKEEKKQALLDRIFVILDVLNNSVLKCRLLLICYGEVYEDSLLDDAKTVIMSWGGRELTEDEKGAMGEYNEICISNRKS